MPGRLPDMPWTNFYLVFAIAREGGVARASAVLGMTHSTLLRKLDTIETRLKTRLFERVHGRYTLTPAGHEIEQAARVFDPVARAAETRVLGLDLRPSGDVRVSVSPILIDYLLAPVLAQFASAFPEVRIELASTREHANLRRREADVAIRVADSVPDWLVGRKLAELNYKIYGRRRDGVKVRLRQVAELAGERRWISFERDARDLKFDRWLDRTVPESNVVLRVEHFGHAMTMVRAGLGIALLPVFVETCVPALQPLTASITELRTPLWLITHPEMRNTTRIKVLMRAFAPALANAVQAAQSGAQTGR